MEKEEDEKKAKEEEIFEKESQGVKPSLFFYFLFFYCFFVFRIFLFFVFVCVIWDTIYNLLHNLCFDS